LAEPTPLAFKSSDTLKLTVDLIDWGSDTENFDSRLVSFAIVRVLF
jgi:hypothetical protein